MHEDRPIIAFMASTIFAARLPGGHLDNFDKKRTADEAAEMAIMVAEAVGRRCDAIEDAEEAKQPTAPVPPPAAVPPAADTTPPPAGGNDVSAEPPAPEAVAAAASAAS